MEEEREGKNIHNYEERIVMSLLACSALLCSCILDNLSKLASSGGLPALVAEVLVVACASII